MDDLRPNAQRSDTTTLSSTEREATPSFVPPEEAPASSRGAAGNARAPSPPGSSPQASPARTVAEDPGLPASVPPPAKRSRRKPVLLVVALAIIAGAGWLGERWWTFGRFQITTDDAYVQADITRVSAKVAGYIAALPVEENQAVKKGDIIAEIDKDDYQVALDSAKTRADTLRATVARIGTQIEAQEAEIAQAMAQVTSANAESVRAEADFKRASALLDTPAGLQKQVDEARAGLDKAKAAVAAANAGVAAAEGQRDVLTAQKVEAERQLAEQLTQVHKAELDLDNTDVRAPVDGVFGNRAVNVGAYVQPGGRIGALVPDDSYYVEANYKETQLAHIKPGLPVSISVDALDGNAVHGTVTSIAPGSGATFSLLPPENATGNFTKITQRVPVRIDISPADQKNPILRPGLSVVVDIDMRGPAASH